MLACYVTVGAPVRERHAELHSPILQEENTILYTFAIWPRVRVCETESKTESICTAWHVHHMYVWDAVRAWTPSSSQWPSDA